jgi:hypothetical protein
MINCVLYEPVKQGAPGRLHIKSNFCTDVIRIHPIRSGTWALFPAELDDTEWQIKYLYSSFVVFDKRQVWDVYCCQEANGRIWDVKRNDVVLRMPENAFEKFFGKYEIVNER